MTFIYSTESQKAFVDVLKDNQNCFDLDILIN
jgi:hypothetical protein